MRKIARKFTGKHRRVIKYYYFCHGKIHLNEISVAEWLLPYNKLVRSSFFYTSGKKKEKRQKRKEREERNERKEKMNRIFLTKSTWTKLLERAFNQPLKEQPRASFIAENIINERDNEHSVAIESATRNFPGKLPIIGRTCVTRGWSTAQTFTNRLLVSCSVSAWNSSVRSWRRRDSRLTGITWW
jgi:hypothetical protein